MCKLKSSNYVCVHCGAAAPSLYKEYSTGVLKLCYCENCKCIIDPYVETDLSIILIDTALQRLKAYRHLLQNDPPEKKWKFILICILCDAYFKWVMYRMRTSKETSYFQLEWEFYLTCFISLIDNTVFVICICIFLSLIRKGNFSFVLTLENIVSVMGCGKLFSVPAVLWGWNEGYINSILIDLFLLISVVQACRVPNDEESLKTIAAVLLAFFIKVYVGYVLNEQVLDNSV